MSTQLTNIAPPFPTGADELASQWPDDVLPPEAVYTSREALLADINKWAKARGYTFITRRTTHTANGRACIYFSCDRGGGKYTSVPDNKRKRKRTTQRTECKFSVIGKESLCKTKWSLRHRPDASFSYHNHEPTVGSGVAHTTHRKLADEDVLMVKKLTLAGVEQRQIKSYLLQNTNTLFIDSDLTNCISRAKQDLANGQSHMVALLHHLDTEGFWSRHLIAEDSRLQSVMFAHPDSVQFARSYPEVLIVDCTYKTNKYKMPLLDMVGVDATGRTFCIAFAYLSGEEEEDFAWALGALRDLYDTNGIPHPSVVLTDRCLACMNAIVSILCFPAAKVMLCLWHINKAVLTFCMGAFTKEKDDKQGQEAWKEFYDSWHELVASKSHAIYDQRLKGFLLRYTRSHPKEVDYLLSTWLNPHKDKFVKAFVNQYLHLNQFVTSRVEGIHSLLKCHLKSSKADLFEAFQIVKLVIRNQLASLKSAQALEQATRPTWRTYILSGSLYSQVRGWISHKALIMVDMQRERIGEGLPQCTGSFVKTTGIPCAHTLMPLIQGNEPLLTSHFHSHWYLQRSGMPPLVFEPRKVDDRRAASKSKPASSTQRDSCAFEGVERALLPVARKPQTCSRCHKQGHNRRSNKCLEKYAEMAAELDAMEGEQDLGPNEADLTPSEAEDAQGRSVSPAAAAATTPQITPTPAYYYLQEPVHEVYAKYKESREAWFNQQPPGASLTDRDYREAVGLPLAYEAAYYRWCRESEQMGQCVKLHNSFKLRDWTMEEMHSWIDADNRCHDEADNRERGLREAKGPDYISRQRPAAYMIIRMQQGGDTILPAR
ncbi:transposase [Fusarium bulbicola]|nr:transposase [Fusarium bulbicola]